MFSFEDLSQCESYSDKLGYARDHLEFLGSGSSRHVFVLSDGKVLKVASNENGMIQNNVEKFYSDTKWDRLSKVHDYDEDFMWIVSERTEPIDEIMFESIFGITMETMYVHLYHQRSGVFFENNPISTPVAEYMLEIIEKRNKTKDVSIIKEIIDKSVEMGINNSDIPRIENWGLRKTKNGDYPVITDYGNFDSRFRKYPSRNQGSVSPQ